MNETTKRIGAQLAELRKLKGISQMQAAEQLGMARQQLCKIEKGNNDTGIGLADRIAKLYGAEIILRLK